MRSISAAHRVMAMGLALLWASCSVTRHSEAASPGPHELTRYALVVEAAPDGQVTHSWKPVEALNLKSLQHSLGARRPPPGIVPVSTDRRAYCEGRRKQCEDDCLASRSPIPVGHLLYPSYKGPWRNNKGWWCRESCFQLSDMCNRGMGDWAEEYAAEFDAIDPAVDWIKKHREELQAGAVIVIAGTAFAVAVVASGGGALILAPLVFLVEDGSELLSPTRFATSSP